MNKYFKKLAEQATEYFPKTETSGEYWKFDKEKFAELIVGECIDVVSDCSVEYCTRPQIASEIKEHFGVEK